MKRPAARLARPPSVSLARAGVRAPSHPPFSMERPRTGNRLLWLGTFRPRASELELRVLAGLERAPANPADFQIAGRHVSRVC
jgi:hypothetical protein